MQWQCKYLIPLLFYFISLNVLADDFAFIKQKAYQGDAVAQYVLGIMYQQAKAVKKNKVTAISWYTKSAKQHYLLAQYALIAVYQHGDGVKVSPEKANDWYKKTAQSRSLIILNKQQQSFTSMVAFLQTLANKNNINAQYLLAHLLASNKQDNMANYWFLRGAMSGDKDAQYYIGITYFDKPGLLNKMQGFYWLEKAAKQNFLDAEIVLASSYEQHNEIAPDLKKASYWYEKAANQGDAKAQSFIAGMYRDGKGVPLDKEKALMWYKKAAKQGDAFSQYNLGQMYETADNGVSPNMKQAIYWYEQGAKQGHTASQLKLQSLKIHTQ